MDPRKNDRTPKPEEEIIQAQAPPTSEEESLDFEQLRDSLHNSTKTTLSHLDQLISESSKRSSKKLYLELFRALVIDSAQASESLFVLFEYVTDLRSSVLLLSMEIEKANGRTSKDVKRLNKKISTLLTSPAVVEIGKILQNMRQISEKQNVKAKTSVKEYLR